MATTFKSLAKYADFTGAKTPKEKPAEQQQPEVKVKTNTTAPVGIFGENSFGLTYRIEVHLPDTTNVDTFRAIFRAIREELMS